MASKDTEWTDKLLSSGRKKYYIVGTIVSIALIGAIIYLTLGSKGNGGVNGEDGETADTSKYGFETGKMGWARQTYTDSQAITAIDQTTTQAKVGSGSLQCTVELIGGDANKSKGEAGVSISNHPPAGVTAPVDLDGKTISAWVYCPAEAAGDTNYPNGLQILMKDEDWDSWYSDWVNVPTAGGWVQLSFSVPDDGTFYLYTENGVVLSNGVFESTKIVEVGVKIGAGTGSTATFSGVIFIDGFTW